MGTPGAGIPSEPGRLTAEDSAEREKREAEKNATKASLNLQATAGNAAAVPTGSEWLVFLCFCYSLPSASVVTDHNAASGTGCCGQTLYTSVAMQLKRI